MLIFPLKIVIFPLKIVIFPWKIVIFPSKIVIFIAGLLYHLSFTHGNRTAFAAGRAIVDTTPGIAAPEYHGDGKGRG